MVCFGYAGLPMQSGCGHMYAAVLADRPYACEPIRKHLADKHGVWITFGTSHAYFWGVVVYGAVPSVHKAAEEIDQEPYHSEGLTIREKLMDMPRGARVADKERVRNFLGVPAASSRSKSKSKLEKDELAEMIRTNGWRERQTMLAAAKEEKEGNPAFYSTLLHMGRKDLDELISWVWDLERKSLLEEPKTDRIQKLCEVARDADCTCGGRWIPPSERVMEIQGLSSVDFRGLVVRALELGKRKGINVLVCGEPDAGKSFAFKPLGLIFKILVIMSV